MSWQTYTGRILGIHHVAAQVCALVGSSALGTGSKSQRVPPERVVVHADVPVGAQERVGRAARGGGRPCDGEVVCGLWVCGWDVGGVWRVVRCVGCV